MLIFCCLPAKAYWAKLDVSDMQQHRFRIESKATRDIRCNVRAFRDNIFVDISAGQTSRVINVRDNVKPFDLSLQCKPIQQATRLSPWRLIRHTQPYYRIFEFY